MNNTGCCGSSLCPCIERRTCRIIASILQFEMRLRKCGRLGLSSVYNAEQKANQSAFISKV